MLKIFVFLIILFSVVPVHADGPVGTLIIDSVYIYEPLTIIPLEDHAYDLTGLDYGAAVLDKTSWNDVNWGRTVIVGHTPGAFDNLTSIKLGDTIIVMTDIYVVEYVVTDIEIVAATADPRDWYTPTDYPSLLLQTCYGEDRLMVVAEMVTYTQ